MKIHEINFFKIFKPTVLVADAAESISNGFKEVFGELINRIMCWSHMGRKCDDRLARISDKEIRANMRTDIYSLQLARNSQILEFFQIKKKYLREKKFIWGRKKFIWGKNHLF